MLECIQGSTCCEFNSITHHGRIMVEFKSPFPCDDLPEEPYYKVPVHHVLQLLAEMALFKALKLWLLCCTFTSVTLIIVSFDAQLWNKLLLVGTDLYAGNKKAIPTRLHPSVQSLKEELKTFVETHCRLVIKVPRFSGVIGQQMVSSLGSPYAVCPNVHLTSPNLEMLHERLCVLASECKLIFKETHSCLRKLARELGTFMLNNKDCLHEDIPNCAPMAYVMKGKYLPIDTLRFLVNTCHDDLQRRNISILCEIYDGQWRNVVNQDHDGNPLTRIQLSKKCWDKIAKLSKQCILEELIQSSQIHTGDKDLITISNLERGVTKSFGNIEINRKQNASLVVNSTGGPMYNEGIIQYMYTAFRTDLWEHPEQYSHKSSKVPQVWSKQIGLREEENLISLLDADVVAELWAGVDNEPEGEDFLPDLTNTMQQTLANDNITLLTDILNELTNVNPKKWQETMGRCWMLQPDPWHGKHIQLVTFVKPSSWWWPDKYLYVW